MNKYEIIDINYYYYLYLHSYLHRLINKLINKEINKVNYLNFYIKRILFTYFIIKSKTKLILQYLSIIYLIIFT